MSKMTPEEIEKKKEQEIKNKIVGEIVDALCPPLSQVWFAKKLGYTRQWIHSLANKYGKTKGLKQNDL